MGIRFKVGRVNYPDTVKDIVTGQGVRVPAPPAARRGSFLILTQVVLPGAAKATLEWAYVPKPKVKRKRGVTHG
jgi:hypothetical protein